MSRAEAWQLTESPVWETRSPYLVKTVLAQKKELESQSIHDKARLRLEADKQHKKAVHLEQQYKQLQVTPVCRCTRPVSGTSSPEWRTSSLLEPILPVCTPIWYLNHGSAGFTQISGHRTERCEDSP